MIKQNLNTSEVRAEQAASTKLQTLKLGLDVHADTIVVVRILDHSAPQPAQKFSPARFLEWVKTQLALEKMIAEELGIRECDAHDWLQANVEHRRVLKKYGR